MLLCVSTQFGFMILFVSSSQILSCHCIRTSRVKKRLSQKLHAGGLQFSHNIVKGIFWIDPKMKWDWRFMDGSSSNSLFEIINHQTVLKILLFWHPDWMSQAASPTQKLHQKFFGRYWVLIFSSENAIFIPNLYSMN